jgi:hypothetical protein
MLLAVLRQAGFAADAASRITLGAYDATGRPLGQRATANLEYTHLNADREAEKAVGRRAQKIAESLPK